MNIEMVMLVMLVLMMALVNPSVVAMSIIRREISDKQDNRWMARGPNDVNMMELGETRANESWGEIQRSCPDGSRAVDAKGRLVKNWSCCADCPGGTSQCYDNCACRCMVDNFCNTLQEQACGSGLGAGCKWDEGKCIPKQRIIYGGDKHANIDSTNKWSYNYAEELLLRPEMTKTGRYNDALSVWEECNSQTKCFRSVETLNGIDSGAGGGGGGEGHGFEVDVLENSAFPKVSLEAWARCASGGKWVLDYGSLKNGEVTVSINGRVDASLAASSNNGGGDGRVDATDGSVSFTRTLKIATANEDVRLEIVFSQLDRAKSSKAFIQLQAENVEPFTEDCMSNKFCADVFGDGTGAGYEMRNVNQRQFQCLGNISALPKDLQQTCEVWTRCLANTGMNSKQLLKGFLGAMLAPATSAATAASTKTTPATTPAATAVSTTMTPTERTTTPVVTTMSATSTTTKAPTTTTTKATTKAPTTSTTKAPTTTTTKASTTTPTQSSTTEAVATTTRRWGGDRRRRRRRRRNRLFARLDSDLIEKRSTDECIEPAIADPEVWECECLSDILSTCAANEIADEQDCFTRHMCSSCKVCLDWKQQGHCTQDEIDASKQCISTAALVGRAQVTARGGLASGLDSAVQGKCSQ